MRYLTLFVFAAIVFCPQAFADDDPERGETTLKYLIYGGDIGDPVHATKKDAKVSFLVEGDLAKKIFESIGPDKKNVCTDGDGSRFRSKDNGKFFCLKDSDGTYGCYFGFDLKTGKSIFSTTC